LHVLKVNVNRGLLYKPANISYLSILLGFLPASLISNIKHSSADPNELARGVPFYLAHFFTVGFS